MKASVKNSFIPSTALTMMLTFLPNMLTQITVAGAVTISRQRLEVGRNHNFVSVLEVSSLDIGFRPCPLESSRAVHTGLDVSIGFLANLSSNLFHGVTSWGVPSLFVP